MTARPCSNLIGWSRGGLLLVLSLFAALGVGQAAESALSAEAAWSYVGETGPAHWAELSPAFAACRSGLQQSPIDIREVQPIPYEPLQFLYRTQALDAVNDGRGVYVVAPSGSELRLRGETYELTSFHFHTPGENLINGRGTAAEVHFVHRDQMGRNLIVVVPIQPARHSNSTLSRIVERLPLGVGERLSYRQVGVNPLFLLPSDKGYFTYTGSLANPPCSEPVTWVILAEPVALEPSLIERLARATGTNVRPAQPLNGRTVFVSRRR